MNNYNNFKFKPKKLKYNTDIKTLDELHQNKNLYFEKKKLELKYKYEIKNKTVDPEINIKLTNEINNIENNTEELNYYIKVGPILIDYYSNNNHSNETGNMETLNSETNNLKNKISDKLIDLHNKSKDTRRVKKEIQKRINKNNFVKKNNSILSYLTTNNTQNEKTDEKTIAPKNKQTLFSKYLFLLNENTIALKQKHQNTMCTLCNIEKTLIISEGLLVCMECGNSEHLIIESEATNNRNATIEKPKYPYKKLNHLIEKLNQFQSKESINIPDDIFEKITFEKNKKKIENINVNHIKQILHKYRLTHLYEHVQYIYCRYTKVQAPTLTRCEEELIKKMFRETEIPFMKHRPNTRSSFLNYSYVINKILILINKKEFLQYFPLLKSKEKLKNQDTIWQKICKDLNWKYVPSF